LTVILWMTVLAVAMLWLGRMAVAFDLHLEPNWWLRRGDTGFFDAMGLSALVFITQLARALRLPTSPSQGLPSRRRWRLASLIPVDMLARGLGCGGCHVICLRLPEGLFRDTPVKLLVHDRQRAGSEPLRELRRHPPALRETLRAARCWPRPCEITDTLWISFATSPTVSV
jgi:hypothetical protein